MNEIPLQTLLVALFVLLLVSGFFSIAETSMMALNRYRLRHRAGQGSRSAQLVEKLLARPDRLIGVVLICGLTPYNDFAVANTFVVGNFLPIGLVLILLVIVLLLNASLHRFVPRRAFREAELAVVTVMMLVACSLPSSGRSK